MASYQLMIDSKYIPGVPGVPGIPGIPTPVGPILHQFAVRQLYISKDLKNKNKNVN
jgi:hypothetical protein